MVTAVTSLGFTRALPRFNGKFPLETTSKTIEKNPDNSPIISTPKTEGYLLPEGKITIMPSYGKLSSPLESNL